MSIFYIIGVVVVVLAVLGYLRLGQGSEPVPSAASKDARLKKIDVRTDGGAVILTGAVSSIGVSARASKLARGVPGVRMVKNELTYDPAKRDGARAPATVGK